ncbi:MAG TPA: FlgD immunoglobulin-like domain containing protein [Candidatus Eisenbacteria bacterium]|nr:FlgD immunoglobulin-like domain containing protein [Candidatus Eisenbacteria bacterium]
MRRRTTAPPTGGRPRNSAVRASLARTRRALLWVLLLALTASPPARAHLALVRQGLDSAGSLEPGDRHGSALATGDFNNDGYDDLAVGAPFDDVTVGMSNVGDAGAVVISYGSKHGITHLGAQLRTAQSIGGSSTIGAQFGYALAAGDFDGDGDDDLAIGAPYETVTGHATAGRVYVLHGGPTGLAATLARTVIQTDLGGVIENGDQFGASFAVGNFDGDATLREDLAIGAPGEDADAGAAFFMHGSATGLTNVGGGWFKASTLGFTDQAAARFGYALAAGRFVGDASVDLIVGAPYHDIGQTLNAGVIYAILGSAGSLTAVGAAMHDATFQGGPQQGALFGFSLAGLRLSVTGNPRLAIGEPLRDVGAVTDAGRVIVVQGGATGFLFGAASVRVLTQELAGTVGQDGDYFGYAVAAGDWDLDGDEDLGVGTPGKAKPGFLTFEEVGLVQVFLSTNTTPAGGPSYRFERDTVDVGLFYGDRFGHALAFGAFDKTNRANLAIGTPGDDDDEDGFSERLFSQYFETDLELDAGCVYILAPWRQALDLPSRSSAVLDCEDELVFSQRPFDITGPASTTKVMTALIALERSQLPPENPDHVDLDAEDWIDGWVADDVGGSSAELEEFEYMSLRNLLRAMMTVSGNDASYAIADLLNGDAFTSLHVPEFALEMRQRAAAIGMTRTYFGNPCGRDQYNALDTLHYSTAYDMVLLGREAMENAAFRALVGMPFYDILRDVVRDGDHVLIPWTYTNDFITGLRAWHDNATGIKPGHTSGAGRTRLFAADSAGRVIAGMYGCPEFDTRNLSKRGASLLRLAFAECGTPLFFSVPNDPPPQPTIVMHGAGTAQGQRKGMSSDASESDTDSLALEVALEQGTGPTSVRLWLERRTEAQLGHGEIARVGLTTFQSHGGLRIRNAGPTPATLFVQASHPSTNATFVLGPGQEVALSAYTGSSLVPFQLQVQNQSADSAAIEVVELAHRLDLTIPLGSGFAGALTHSPTAHVQALKVETLGLDANPGNAVRVVIRPFGAPVVGVPSPAAARVTHAITVLPAGPNPFSERVELTFDLARRGQVGLTIYDIAGRRVRAFEPQPLAPGRWSFEWDGTGSGGERLASGVFFVRFRLDGAEVADQKLVVMR